jgi:hypothetical protein
MAKIRRFSIVSHEVPSGNYHGKKKTAPVKFAQKNEKFSALFKILCHNVFVGVRAYYEIRNQVASKHHPRTVLWRPDSLAMVRQE